MMKKLLTLSVLSMFASTSLLAQHEEDTLINHASGLPLSTNEYSGTNQWGYYAGMSHKKQEGFGERYEISEHGDVIGVIIHVKGTVTNDENEAHVRIFDVASDGKPGTEIENGHIHFHDLNLDGSATVVMLNAHAHVHDTFFAVFDIGDYAHGGYEGDTIGLLYSPDGSRATADLGTLYRNVTSEHSHGATSWEDFYTQNFTPIATHFAIYPIVEFEHEHTAGLEQLSDGILTFSAPYPNPAENTLSVPFSLKEDSNVEFEVLDLTGKQVLTQKAGISNAGLHTHQLDISALNSGHYIIIIKTERGSLATKISKK